MANGPFQSLKNITLVELVQQVAETDKAIEFAMQYGLLAARRDCSRCACAVPMVLEAYDGGQITVLHCQLPVADPGIASGCREV